jgi:hypothetical protein
VTEIENEVVASESEEKEPPEAETAATTEVVP